jgi:ATP-dependent protease ClpP protease subunit
MTKNLNIFGDIVSTSWGLEDVSPSYVTNEIKDLTAGDELIVNIDCFGGEIFAAVAIRSILKNSPAKKTFNILGICASSANTLFDENDTINIANGAMVMNHKPSAAINGNAIDLRTQADVLDKVENEIILKNLHARTGKPINELSQLLVNGWWLTSGEAVNLLKFGELKTAAIMNHAKTAQEIIYKNYLERKQTSSVDAYTQFMNIKKRLSK